MRTFTGTSSVVDNRLTLELAPGLSRNGVEDSPSFFSGFTNQPQVVARGLVTLADITATRYYNYTPESERDPILSAHGDRLRAECFSACNGVYACFELMSSALDGGDIGYGTTNVDISSGTRRLLSSLPAGDVLHLDVGSKGLRATTMTQSFQERPVSMPPRWLPALGNTSEILKGFTAALQVDAADAKAFLASVPPASATSRSAWLSIVRNKLKISTRPLPHSIHIPGIHRFSALKRLLPHAQRLTVFQPDEGYAGAVVSLDVPGARMTVTLTEEAWRGFSGEGSLLMSLAKDEVRDDADVLTTFLAFEPSIDAGKLAKQSGLSPDHVSAGLALLAGSGRVGWDPHAKAYFHRELPDDQEKTFRSNPRLAAAQKLSDGGFVRQREGDWLVRSGTVEYIVRLQEDQESPEQGASCNCRWYVAYGGNRGPCKHVLAAILCSGRTP